MLQNSLSCFLLLVRRIAVLSQDALDHCPHLGPDALFHGPINRGVLADRVQQFQRDLLQCFIAKNLNGTVIRFERIVKCQFFLAQAQLFAPLMSHAHIFGEVNQFLDHLRRLERAVLIFVDRLFQLFSDLVPRAMMLRSLVGSRS